MLNKVVLVVAAHSDDEALGCAGTMAKHVGDGDEVHVLFMTDGVGSRQLHENSIGDRLSAAKNASKIIGVSTIKNLDFPDNKMDTVSLLDITKTVEQKIKEVQPHVIYTHHIGDLNVDHQVTHKAVMTACRPQPDSCVKEIYSFEVLSSTEWQTSGFLPFIPNVFVDISEYLDVKRKVLEAYGAEMRMPPHSRSVENIISYAGMRGHTVGTEYAEAFISIREVK
jgi:LmbE family N-acetylglucosaminyl deacetylase